MFIYELDNAMNVAPHGQPLLVFFLFKILPVHDLPTVSWKEETEFFLEVTLIGGSKISRSSGPILDKTV